MEQAELTRAGRVTRLAVTAIVTVLLTAGTVWGDDDEFPFGPMRMFSTSSKPTGAISVASIEARTNDGTWFRAPLSPTTVGMNRAEVEGQIAKFERDPQLLGRLSAAHDRLRPQDEPWVAVRLLRISTVLENRRPVGERRTVLAEWVLE
ncbi:MAG: hypothetical protein M3Q27_10985 [Actinomycetota bacterium]|nr:hypothetical protein [Actinomycetota bacterium]